MKKTLSSLILVFVFIGPSALASGISDETKSQILSDLSNYEPLPVSGMSAQESDALAKFCKDLEGDTPTSKRCLESKYIINGFHVVRIGYKRGDWIPPTPDIVIIPRTTPLVKDSSARNAFLEEWNDRVLTEYLGSDYLRFNSAKFIGSNEISVGIEVLVKEASELESVFEDDRILDIQLITNAPKPLEEILN